MTTGQVALTPGENEWDCPTSTPANNTNVQEQHRQEMNTQQQYSDHIQQLENSQNIVQINKSSRSRKTNIDKINDILHSTASDNSNHNQHLSQRQRKRLNKATRLYKDNRPHNLSDGPYGVTSWP